MSEASRNIKTPWNPSKKAIQRVKNPLPTPVVCPRCGGKVAIVENKEIYGKNYGEWPWTFRCESSDCDSFVGMHPYTNIPLGTLATAEIRNARKLTKELFQKLWLGDGAPMTRTEAYQWLAVALEVPAEECHFGWFNIETCRRAYRILRDRLNKEHQEDDTMRHNSYCKSQLEK